MWTISQSWRNCSSITRPLFPGLLLPFLMAEWLFWWLLIYKTVTFMKTSKWGSLLTKGEMALWRIMVDSVQWEQRFPFPQRRIFRLFMKFLSVPQYLRASQGNIEQVWEEVRAPKRMFTGGASGCLYASRVLSRQSAGRRKKVWFCTAKSRSGSAVPSTEFITSCLSSLLILWIFPLSLALQPWNSDK